MPGASELTSQLLEERVAHTKQQALVNRRLLWKNRIIANLHHLLAELQNENTTLRLIINEYATLPGEEPFPARSAIKLTGAIHDEDTLQFHDMESESESGTQLETQLESQMELEDDDASQEGDVQKAGDGE